MAVNKVIINTENGAETLVDLTNDNVTPETLAVGATAHDASGNVINGILSPKDGKDGKDGERGTGILKVTTAPTSYTTATGGKNPIKRMSLSTIKTQSGVNNVLVGDCISYSYYLYHIYYIDDSYAYMDTYQSIRGAAGTNGTNGTDGKTPVKGTDYFTEADKTEFVEEVSSTLANELLETITVNDTLTWDGNTEGKTVFDMMGDGSYTYYPVSENVITLDDLANGLILESSDINGNGTETLKLTDFAKMTNNVIASQSVSSVLFVLADNTSLYGKTIPKKGVYFMRSEAFGVYASRIKIDGYTGFSSEVEVIKEKYIPEHEHDWEGLNHITAPTKANVGQTIMVKAVDENGKPTEWKAVDFPEGGGGSGGVTSWNDLTDKPFGYGTPIVIADGKDVPFDEGEEAYIVPASSPIEVGDMLEVTIEGLTYITTVSMEMQGVTFFGNTGIGGLGSDTGEPFMGGYVAGMFLILIPDFSDPVDIKIAKLTIVKIPSNYLPERTRFYLTNIEVNRYIYTDSQCTIKATKNDIPDSVDFDIGLTQDGIITAWVKPTMVLGKYVTSTILNHNMVDVTLGGELVSFYTAEYTPPNTAEE